MSDRILRLQHVEVRVPDLELCTAYYTEVVGLVETAHEERRGQRQAVRQGRAGPRLGRGHQVRGALRPPGRARLRDGEGRQHAAPDEPAAAPGGTGGYRATPFGSYFHHGRGRRRSYGLLP